MKAVILNHKYSDDIGNLGSLLTRCGVDFEVIQMPETGLPPDFDPLAPDLMIIMGGAPGVYQADDYDFINAEIGVAQERFAAGKAMLGFCLGLQIMLAALGAKIVHGSELGKRPELGWYHLHLTDAGERSPVRHLGEQFTKVAESHGDTAVALPDGVVLLGSTDQYPIQAVAIGKNSIGMQFHPEADAAGLNDWILGCASTAYRAGIDVKTWRAESPACQKTQEAQFEKFLIEYIDTLRHDLAVGQGRVAAPRLIAA